MLSAILLSIQAMTVTRKLQTLLFPMEEYVSFAHPPVYTVTQKQLATISTIQKEISEKGEKERACVCVVYV